jgi:hypothetical protein
MQLINSNCQLPAVVYWQNHSAIVFYTLSTKLFFARSHPPDAFFGNILLFQKARFLDLATRVI